MVFLAALAWILGAGSLLLLGAFLWTGSLDVFELSLSQRSLLPFDAALCAAFFLQHSILIRRSVRTALRKYIPDYCYGVSYTITSGAALLLLVLLWQRSAGIFYELIGTARIAMRAVLIMAFAGFFWGIRSLKRFDAFGIDALRAHLRGIEDSRTPLTVVGPYRYVRHPFYAFAILAFWATPLLSLDRLLLNVLFTGWIWLGATFEERDLQNEFGEAYVQYRKAVPMFVPLIGAMRRKVMNKESTAGRRAA